MFSIHPQSKVFFKKNLFLISLILNNSAILKITLTTGLLLIFSKFIIFNTIFFQNLTLNTITKAQIQIYSLFHSQFFRQNYQLVWHSNSNQFVLISPNNLLTMTFYPLSIRLTITTLAIIIFLNFLLPILPTSPMTPIKLTKVLTFPLLFVIMQNNTLFLLLSIPPQAFLFKLFPPLQMS